MAPVRTLRALVALTFSAAGLCAGACGLEDSGEAGANEDGGVGGSATHEAGDGFFPLDSPSTADTGSPPSDAGIDVPVPVDVVVSVDVINEPLGPCSEPIGTCVTSVPAGWEVVAFAVNPAAPCPADYVATDKPVDPDVAPGACDCACTITSPPCVTGTIPTAYSDATQSCAFGGSSLAINGSGCTSLGGGGNLHTYYKSPAVPVGGACTTSEKSDPSKLTLGASRACQPPLGCQEAVCNGNTPAGFASCIRSPGDVACPAGPFVQKHLAVDSAAFTCSACSGCSVSATCSNPTISFYSNGSCTSLVTTVASNNTCVGTGGGGFVAAYKYQVNVQNPTCTGNGAKQATLQPQNPVTVCCR